MSPCRYIWRVGMPTRTRAAAGLIAILAGACWVTACGPATGPPPPTPTPLPAAELRARYVAAASAYDEGSANVAGAENAYCGQGASADLSRCELALSADRLATVTFDDAVRQLRFPASAQPAVGRLLADDAQLESLLQQASTAPSLTAIAALTPQIFQLLVSSAHAADDVRAAIGLPVSSPSPSL